jgi:hypothetical protein
VLTVVLLGRPLIEWPFQCLIEASAEFATFTEIIEP